MKQIKGTCIHIDNPYIGRVIAKHNCTYILKSLVDGECIITPNYVNYNKVFICSDTILEIGDIVKIIPSGLLLVMYVANSDDNALFISERCNNNCIMCPQIMKKNPSNFLDENIEILNLLDDSPKYLGITGGEPTSEWKNLLEIVKIVTQKHPNTIIQLLTNGRIFKDEKYLIEINQINSNILYCIPLYSDNPNIHNTMVGNDNAFSETIDGLYNLAKHKCPIELRTVITKLNYKRLPAYTSWVYKNLPFISHLAIMGMEPIYFARKNLETLWVDPIDYSNELYKACQNLVRCGLPFFIYNHQLCVIHKELRGYCCKTISGFKQIYLESCKNCSQRSFCGGLFESAKYIHSRAIKAIEI